MQPTETKEGYLRCREDVKRAVLRMFSTIIQD